MTRRQVFDEVWYEPGDYILVPLTSGGLLQRPFVESTKRDWAELPIAERFDYLDYYTTFVDIFRKIDLSLNRVLDDNELN